MSTAPHTTRQRSARGLLLLTSALVLGMLGLTGAAPAVAATVNTDTTAPARTVTAPVSSSVITSTDLFKVVPAAPVPDAGDGDETARSIYDSQFRTMNRWGDATTGFFTKYDGFIGTQLIDQAQRGVNQSMQMAIGNLFMSITANAAQWAVSFQAIDQIGKTIDDVTKQIVVALFTNGNGNRVVATALVITIVLILLITVVVQSLRRGGISLMFRRLAGILVIFGLLFTMASAALNSNGRTDANGKYQPVPLTPGWVVKTLNDGVAGLAEMPARVFVDGVQPLVTAAAPGMSTSSPSYYDPNGNLSCARLNNAFQQRLKTQQDNASDAGSGGLVAITSVMDQLWEDTGLQTWKQIQTGFNNPFGTKMYCRILEDRSTVSTPLWSAYYTAKGQPAGWDTAVFSTYNGQNAPFSPDSAANTAASYVGWAACKPTRVSGKTITWQWESGWVGFKGGTGGVGGAGTDPLKASDAQALCSQWWAAVSTDGAAQDIPDQFDISGEAGWIDDRTKGIETTNGRDKVRDFLYALTGVNASGGATATWAYAISSGLQFIAFGFLSALTFLAKLFAAMFAIALWFVLLGALFTANPFKDRILRAFNRFLGVTIFASMMTVIMTFVVLFSRALITIGNTWFGAGTIFAMVWAGFAPVAALLLVHLLFTKVFKMPSPVTMSGAQAWNKAGASGALGAAAAAGVGGYAGSRLGAAAKNWGSRAGRAAGNAALSKATGGRLGSTPTRRSGMGAGPRKEALDEAQEKAADTLTPKQVKAQVTADRKQELTEARAWHRAQTGQAAPGDLKGSVADLGARAAERARELAQSAQEKIAATPLARELHSRADHRQMVREARRTGNTAALEEERQRQRASVSAATARIAAVMDAPAAIANRARLGVESTRDAGKQAATRVWNSPKVVGARADAAILAGSTRQAVKYVAQSDVGRAATVVARHASKPVVAAARGTAAVANRNRNNAELIEKYRAAMATRKKPADAPQTGTPQGAVTTGTPG